MATETIVTEHYNGKYPVAFYPKSHKRKIVGTKEWLDGVTSATNMLDKSTPLLKWADGLVKEFLLAAVEAGEPLSEELIKEAIGRREVEKKEAGDSGTLVHEWAEAYIKGRNPKVPEDKAVRNGVLGFLKWVRDYDVKFLESEKYVFSEKYWYHGIMDCSFTMGKGENHKIKHPGDFKTGSGIYPDQAFQVAAYQHADTEEHGTVYGSKWILRFIKKDKYDKTGKILVQRAGDFEAKEFAAEEHEAHFESFLACLKLKRQSKIFDKKHGYNSPEKKEARKKLKEELEKLNS